MTNRTIPFSAQWALEGKQPDGEDYRVLACSTSDLTRANFADALSRFQLGELSTLPQVSVSYARHGVQPSLNYVALAIHWYATEGQRHADGVSQRDNQGRRTAYTSYFCLPYRRLAEAAIGYLAMYDALRAVTLTVADGPPIEVPLTMPTSRTPAADDRAVRVAPLLLTGLPVCVLGAEDTSMLERLKFIDAVMELLPYGFRSRMTAATWTRATNRTHRFRLFFSSAPRTDEPEYVVTWGDDPALVQVPDGEAGEYFDWLQDNLGPLARLTELTSEMGFTQKNTLQALEAVLGTRHRLHHRPQPAAAAPNGRPAVPTQPTSAQADVVREALAACAEHARLENPTRLRADINVLRKLADGEVSENSRLLYQNLIGRYGLLRKDFPAKGKVRERLYDALLRLAFWVPLSYRAYCRVERCAGIVGGAAPHEQLLAAIEKSGMTDPFVSAIVYWHLGATDEKKLNKWLVSGQVDVVRLIELLAVGSSYPQHARIVCDVTLKYLANAPNCYQPREVRAVLREHGFLAHALQNHHPDQDQYQVHALYHFLKAAYPQPAATPGQDLSKAAIQQILNGTGPPPTPALLSAVLMSLHKPESCELAWTAYIHGSLTRPNFDDRTRARLRERLPALDASTITRPVSLPGDLARPTGT
jgi:hypothetical protein